MTKTQIEKRLNELNQRGLTQVQLRNQRYLATRRPLTPAESDEVVSYFKQSEISDFGEVVRAELSILRRWNHGREFWPCFRLYRADGSYCEPSLQQATETRAHYVTRHLREAVDPEIKEFMRGKAGMVCHHMIPFSELVDDFCKQHSLSLDDLFGMVKRGETQSFAEWHRQSALLKAVTKDEHYEEHLWKKPSASEGDLFEAQEDAG